jgi:putative membrane protein
MNELIDPHTLVSTVVYSLVGLIVFGAAFLGMVKMAPFSVKKELEEDQNIALAILMGSVIIGLAIVVAAAIHGG